MQVIVFILLFVPWLISGMLFPFNMNFSVEISRFNPDIMITLWIFIYFLITVVFCALIKHEKVDRHYLFTFLVNYILNQTVSLFMFYFNSFTLTFINICLLFLSTIILFMRTYKIKRNLSKLLIPYLLIVFLSLVYFIFLTNCI